MSYCNPQKYVSIETDTNRETTDAIAPYFIISMIFDEPRLIFMISKDTIYKIKVIGLSSYRES